jgi:hypothetical protein
MGITHFYGVKGGSGVTTQAVLFALGLQGKVALWDRNGGDAFRLLGLTAPGKDGSVSATPDLLVGTWWLGPVGFDHLVIDNGQCSPPQDSGERVLAIRADYLSLRAAANPDIAPDRAVVLAEPGCALQQRDVEAVLGVPVTWVVRDTAIGRAVDAGLVTARFARA